MEVRKDRLIIALVAVIAGCFLAIGGLVIAQLIWSDYTHSVSQARERRKAKRKYPLDEAVQLINERRDREAIPLLDQILARDERNAAAYYYRGNAYLNTQQPDRALANYNMLLMLRPTWPEGYRVRARAYRAKNDYDAAIADLSRAIQLRPEFVEAYLDRATDNSECCPNLGGRIRLDLDRALRLAPNDPVVLNAHAVELISLKDYDQAFEELDRAIDLDPKYALPYCNRGLGLYQEGRKDEAQKDFDRCVKLDPQMVVTLRNATEGLDQLPQFNAWMEQLARARTAGAEANRCNNYSGDRKRACEQGHWSELRYFETGEVD